MIHTKAHDLYCKYEIRRAAVLRPVTVKKPTPKIGIKKYCSMELKASMEKILLATS